MASTKKIAHPARRTKRATTTTTPEPDSRILEALGKLDGALMFTMANTVGREGAGTDAHNLAVAMKAAVDLRSLLQIAEVL